MATVADEYERHGRRAAEEAPRWRSPGLDWHLPMGAGGAALAGERRHHQRRQTKVTVEHALHRLDQFLIDERETRRDRAEPGDGRGGAARRRDWSPTSSRDFFAQRTA
jgi:hypothetical protein